jgi:TonB family protein
LGEAKPMMADYPLSGKAGQQASIFIGSANLGENWFAPDSSPPCGVVTPAQEVAATSITFSYTGKRNVFKTGPLDKAFAALRTCTDDLVRSWGLDSQQQSHLSRYPQPLGEPRLWVRSEDYPTAMLSASKQGLVNFRLAVDAQGAATSCEIQRSIGDKAFDLAACTALKRSAHFTPATDAKGRPVASFYLSSIKWILN